MAFVKEIFTVLRAEIEDLRARHRSNMISRIEILNQIIALQYGIQNKVIAVVQSPFSSDAANIP
jgi:hypothetical protein